LELEKDIEFNNLPLACFIYKLISDDDKAYNDFLLDKRDYFSTKEKGLADEERKALNNFVKTLIKFLRKWGCRNLAEKNKEKIDKKLVGWFKDWKSELKSLLNLSILHLNEQHFSTIRELYDSLYEINSIGATTASKILFAINPEFFIPWDEEIRKSFNFKESSDSYIKYLSYVKRQVQNLAKNDELLNVLNKIKKIKIKKIKIENKIKDEEDRRTPLNKFIDEYFWITITKKFDLSKIKDILKELCNLK